MMAASRLAGATRTRCCPQTPTSSALRTYLRIDAIIAAARLVRGVRAQRRRGGRQGGVLSASTRADREGRGRQEARWEKTAGAQSSTARCPRGAPSRRACRRVLIPPLLALLAFRVLHRHASVPRRRMVL